MRGCHHCRLCGEGVAGGEEEQHTSLHHPRDKFARSDSKTREGEVDVKVKGTCKSQSEEQMITLEEVVELGEVMRKPGETRVMLTKGEADIVLGRDFRTVEGLRRKTGAHISIKGDLKEGKRDMVITGKQELVLTAEESIAKVLAKNTCVEVKLRREELLCVIGVGGEKVVKIQDKSGACINTGKKVKTNNPIKPKAEEVSMMISGSPESVASAQSMIQDFLNSGKEIEVTERQARVLVGRGGSTIRDLQDTTDTKIANFRKESVTEMQKFKIYGSEKAKEKALERISSMLENV